MRFTIVFVFLIVLCLTLPAFAQPNVTAVFNAASYAAAPNDSNGKPIANNNISQGSIIVIFGTNLGPASLVQASALPLTTSLPNANGTSVTVSSGGQNISAFMVYTFASQVAAILPSNVPVGPATLTVTFNGQRSNAVSVNVVATQFGIFTQNSQGNGPAVAQVFASSTSVSLMKLTTPAQPGQTLVLYGTGLGAISGADNTPPGAVQVGSNVIVNIAGTVVPALYAGRSPNFPGLDQINFTLPANVSTGCYVPAEVTASGRPSNLFYLSIASGSGACVHPLGLSSDVLARLDTPGGTANIGLFQMLRAVVLGLPAEGAGGLFETVDANAAFQNFSQIVFSFGGYNYPIPVGSCAVLDTIDPPAGFNIPDLHHLGGTELRSADFLSLSGTNGNSATILRQMDAGGNDIGGYLGVFFSTLGKGTWTLQGGAGKDVSAFTAKVDLPDDLVWTNAGNFANPPRDNLTITWTGGATTPQSIVTVTGASVVINPTDPSKTRGKQFYCNANASDGRVVVPASVTQQLPATAGNPGEVGFANLGIYSGNGATFTTSLTNGAKFDGGFFSYGEAHTISVKYQ